MRPLKIIFAATALGLSVTASAQTVSTQPAAGASAATSATRSATRGNGSGARTFTVTQMRRIQDALQATDDEWKVIQPRVEKIESLRRAIQNSRFGARGRRGNPTAAAAPSGVTASQVAPTPPAAGDQTELLTATRQLEEALDNKNTQPQDLKVRLAALREARAQTLAEFTKAQDDLREILTARQEAVLVTLGLLN